MSIDASTVGKAAQLLPLLHAIQSDIKDFVQQLNTLVRSDDGETGDELPPILSRAEAQTRNLPTYYTGTPCVRGHLSERFTRNYACIECNRVANRERGRELAQLLKERCAERGQVERKEQHDETTV